MADMELTGIDDVADPNPVQRFCDAEYSRMLLSSLVSLRERELFTDVSLCTAGAKIPCHRVVLSAASPYFLAMFSSGLEESTSASVDIHEIDATTLGAVVDYIYSSNITITTTNVQSLMQACELFHFVHLKKACERFMVQQVDPLNCVGLYHFAKLYSLADLRVAARGCMLSQFTQVVGGTEFLQMAACDLIEYIADDDLQVRTEDPVFDAVLSWTQHHLEHSTEQISDIISHVRLPYCSSNYICYILGRNSLFQGPGRCVDYLDEARLYHMVPERRSELTGPRTVPRTSFGCDNKLVLVGGLTKDDRENRYCWYLREDTASWELLAQLPKPNWKFYSMCVIPNMGILVTGGYYGNVKRDCWLFDTSEKKWKPMAAMLDVRCKHRTVVHGNVVYAMGGEDDFDRPLSSVECFDLTNKRWQRVTSMDKALSDPLVTSYGRYIYVFGGIENNDATSTSSKAYDTVWDKWLTRAEMPEPCRLGAISLVNERIYVLTGYSRTALCYHPDTDQWTRLNRPRQKHGNAPAVVWDGHILVGGGDVDQSETTSVIEQYNPEQDTWSFWKISLKEELSCHHLLNVPLCGL